MHENDVALLRALLREQIGLGTHKEITARFVALGLEEAEADKAGSRPERVQSMVDRLAVPDLRRVVEHVLRTEEIDARLRNDMQDLLWVGAGPVIEERTRRDLAGALLFDDMVVDRTRFEALLDRWWVLGGLWPFDDVFSAGDRSTLATIFGPDSNQSLRKQIHRHVFDNPGDWSVEMLFDRLGAFEAVDRRFGGFLEDLVSHTVLLREERQQQLVSAIAPHLRRAHLELHEVDRVGGYPVFRLVSTQTPTSRPKNVIFASSQKPDLRMSSAVDSEIEIVDARGALIYDAPIGPEGLRWKDLLTWWQCQHTESAPDKDRDALYKRLVDCLPTNSPPQRRLFGIYHHLNWHHIDSMPALLPEVWLHWDPKTVRERGVRALLGQRMDFLILGPNQQRIILEVDGSTHYTDEAGRPSPSRYAQNTRYDRDMQLRGYTVYRFGAAELADDEQATALLTDFFGAMFDKHAITVGT